MVAKGRPRDPGVNKRVTEAVMVLLAEKGYSGLRIDDVASVSGVAKTTIYRRWSSLQQLVVDTIAANLGGRQLAVTDDPVADLRQVCVMLVESIGTESNPVLAVALDLHRQSDKELRTRYREQIIDPARHLLVDTLSRVKGAGRLRSTLAPADLADMFIGATIYRLGILREPMTANQVEAIVDQITVSGSAAS